MVTASTIQQLFNLSGRVAIVTGSAEGIGNAIAQYLAAAGAQVVIADINVDGATAAAQAISEAGGRARAFHLDQSQEESIVAMVAAVRAELGPVHILVNNAGVVDEAPLESTTAAQWDRLHNVNLRGAFLCLREVAKAMREDAIRGRIINISSMGSLHPIFTGLTAYNATKAGINGMTRNAAYELAGDGITVNAVLPGSVITDGQLRRQVKPIDEALLRRMCSPEDIARAVLFFASAAAEQVTAQFLVVDGGHLNS